MFNTFYVGFKAGVGDQILSANDPEELECQSVIGRGYNDPIAIRTFKDTVRAQKGGTLIALFLCLFVEDTADRPVLQT